MRVGSFPIPTARISRGAAVGVIKQCPISPLQMYGRRIRTAIRASLGWPPHTRGEHAGINVDSRQIKSSFEQFVLLAVRLAVRTSAEIKQKPLSKSTLVPLPANSARRIRRIKYQAICFVVPEWNSPKKCHRTFDLWEATRHKHHRIADSPTRGA